MSSPFASEVLEYVMAINRRQVPFHLHFATFLEKLSFRFEYKDIKYVSLIP